MRGCSAIRCWRSQIWEWETLPRDRDGLNAPPKHVWVSRGLELEDVQWLWLCSLSLPSLARVWAGELH